LNGSKFLYHTSTMNWNISISNDRSENSELL
jgi:hypothetical protein